MTMVLGNTPRSTRSGADVPFLPGYSVMQEKSRHHKSQTLSYGPGGGMDKLTGGTNPHLPKLDLSQLEAMKDPQHRYNMTKPSMTHDERESARESQRNTYRPAISPAWLKHDRQVLRFFAYFQEPVVESPMENFRIRHCVILFHLEDGTMMIIEPKEENSGIPQGTFVKRHRIPNPRGGFYTYKDLRCGTTISIYSRAFRVTDVDDFTKAFLEEALGENSGVPEGTPLDSFRANKTEASPMKPVSVDKEYIELSIGGNRKNAKLQQYLENDRKVLCFWCYWDDPTRYGARMYYKLHYFLTDDTVEVLEQLARNSGRAPYPVFWRRAPLLRNPYVAAAPGMPEPDPLPYKPEDFIVGGTVQVYGRDVFLYRCDEFTKDFYRQYMGYDQGEIGIEKHQRVHQQLTFPPHTGFGAEEDSLASCLHLTPRPPYRDINKLMNDADKVMRFEGRMMTGTAEDDTRRFVIAIWLADYSILIWEKRQRNSGHNEGKFAFKARKKNPRTGTWFHAKDFYIGETVEINSTPFLLINADEGTLNYMEANPGEFPVADLGRILAKFHGRQDEVRALIQQKSSAAAPEDVRQAVEEQFGVSLCLHEVLTAIRALSQHLVPHEALSGRQEILDSGVASALR